MQRIFLDFQRPSDDFLTDQWVLPLNTTTTIADDDAISVTFGRFRADPDVGPALSFAGTGAIEDGLPTDDSEFNFLSYANGEGLVFEVDGLSASGEVLRPLFEAFEGGTVEEKVRAVDAFEAARGIHLDGSSGDDGFRGSAVSDVLRGQDGDDTLLGRGGDDLIRGGVGSDSLEGNAGFDEIRGGFGDDTIDGGAQPDSIFGLLGDDLLRGGGGPDIMNGGRGDDDVLGGPGDDVLFGGRGWDILRGQAGDDTLAGGPGEDFLIGGGGNDVLNGGRLADVIRGGPGNDVINLGPGSGDRAAGGPGDDVIVSDSGRAFLSGGDGDDQLEALQGLAVMRGGAGADTFYAGYAEFVRDVDGGRDAVADFEPGVDTIAAIGVETFADISIADTDKGALVSWGDTTEMMLREVSAADLGADDFIFV